MLTSGIAFPTETIFVADEFERKADDFAALAEAAESYEDVVRYRDLEQSYRMRAERERILELSAFEALQIANRLDKLPPPAADDATGWLVRDTLNSLSDLFVYGAPIYLQLMQFDEVKASGLQLTRSPGKNVVYFGSLLLTLGVFFMFYVRERRVWIRIKSGHALLAMSAAKHTLDFDKEFAQHAQALDTLAK